MSVRIAFGSELKAVRRSRRRTLSFEVRSLRLIDLLLGFAKTISD